MKPLRITVIKDEVAREFKLGRHDIDSDRQAREVSVPRHIAYKLSKLHTTYSYPRIGREFGRDHTTILTGIRSIDRRLEREPELKDRFDAINARLDQLATPNSDEGENDGRAQVQGHGEAAEEEGPPDPRAADA